MKYLKTYENFNDDYTINDIKVGYYAKANYGNSMDKEVRDFLDDNFGIITYINRGDDTFEIRYKNVPDNIINYFLEFGYMRLIFHISGLIEFAPTKKELELKLATKKYNL